MDNFFSLSILIEDLCEGLTVKFFKGETNMDVETYKKVSEIIRMIRMAHQVEEMACLHVEKILADCMEIEDIKVNETKDFGELIDYEKNNLDKIEFRRTEKGNVIMTFHEKDRTKREMTISSRGVLEYTMQLFNHISNKLLETLSPEIKQVIDDATDQNESDKKS